MLAGLAVPPVFAVVPAQASGQDAPEPTPAAQEERPLVERIRFEGVERVDEDALRAGIVTRETECRGTFLLWPLCRLTNWSAVERREYLDRDEIPLDELRLEVLYFRRGYRGASAAAEVLPRGRGVEVVFHLVEGPPTLVERLDVGQAGEAVLTDGQIRRAQLPREGDPLDLDRLESALVELTERLHQRGYLDASVEDDVDVAREENRAGVEVLIAPGPRSTLEELDIRGNDRVADDVIVDAIRLRPGRVLRSNDILASQRGLYESNLFHEARIELPPQPDSAKRLEITVREAPPRSTRVGGGFSTIEFIQLEARYGHFNWLGGGRRLELQGAVGNLLADELNGQGIFRDVLPPSVSPDEARTFLRPTWRAGVDLMQPGFLSAENRVGVGVFASRRIVPGVVVDEGFGGNASLTRRLTFRAPVTLEYRFELTAVDAGDLYFCAHFGICDLPSIAALRGRHRLSPLGLAFFTDTADDPLSPRSGYRARLELEHASSATVSDFRYNRISGEATGYLPLDVLRRRILSGRVRLGWVGALGGTADALGVEAPGLTLLHPRRRFFAGGSRSVRGFGENQLGPRVLTVAVDALTGEDGPCTPAEVEDRTCDPNLVPIGDFVPRPLGGRSVVEASVEYRMPLFGAFRAAAFLDAAVVSDGLGDLFTESVAAVTPGLGIRYDSPVAPIRVDLGFRPTVVEHLAVLTELVDDGERRLVHLAEPRRYDPVGEAEGGFLRRLMAHLRLHVSIGEAF